MDLKGIRIVSIILHVLFFLFYAYFFMASMFFTGQSFFKVLTSLSLSLTLPLLFTIVIFLFVQYRIIIELNQGLMFASNEANVYISLNIIILGGSFYNLLKQSGGI